jgi:hypothetical protein
MYDWIITYNPYEQSWKAYHREDHMRFWNGMRTQYITFEATAADELVAMIFQHHRP